MLGDAPVYDQYDNRNHMGDMVAPEGYQDSEKVGRDRVNTFVNFYFYETLLYLFRLKSLGAIARGGRSAKLYIYIMH